MSYPTHVVCGNTYASFATFPLGTPCSLCEHAPMLHGEDGCGVCIVIYLTQRTERMLALSTPDMSVDKASSTERVVWSE